MSNQNVGSPQDLKSSYAKKRTGNIQLVEIRLIREHTKGLSRFGGEPLPAGSRFLKG